MEWITYREPVGKGEVMKRNTEEMTRSGMGGKFDIDDVYRRAKYRFAGTHTP